MFIGQQGIGTQKCLVVHFHDRREVYHNPARRQLDGLGKTISGNFALQENQLRCGDGGGVGGDEGGVDKRIGSRHHNDGVLTLLVHSNDGQAGHLVCARNMLEVHAAGLKVMHGRCCVGIAAHRAHKAHTSAQ